MRRLLFILLALVPALAAAEPITKRPSRTPVVTAVSVTTSATALPSTAAANRISACFFNNGAVPVYLGPSGVTTSTGLPLAPGAVFCDDVGGQVYYGIVGSGTAEVRVLEN